MLVLALFLNFFIVQCKELEETMEIFAQLLRTTLGVSPKPCLARKLLICVHQTA